MARTFIAVICFHSSPSSSIVGLGSFAESKIIPWFPEILTANLPFKLEVSSGRNCSRRYVNVI